MNNKMHSEEYNPIHFDSLKYRVEFKTIKSNE